VARDAGSIWWVLIVAVVNKAFLRKLIDFTPITSRIRASVVGPAWAFIVTVINHARRHKVSMLARQAAYSLLYAVPSAVVLIVAIATLIDQRTGSELYATLSDFIHDEVPEETQPLLDELLRQALVETTTNQATVAAILSVLVALWGGSGGTGALVFSCNDVYDVGDKRNFFIKKLMNLMLTLLQGIAIISSLVLLTLGHRIVDWLESETGTNPRILTALASDRAIAASLVFVSLFILYSVAPDVEKQYRWLLPGTAFATLGILGLFTLLDNLLSVFDPGSAYNLAGSVLVFLWFLYIISLVIVIGAVLNAVIGERYDRKLKAFLKAHPERRIRDARGIEHPEGASTQLPAVP
jgi:membrane protein